MAWQDCGVGCDPPYVRSGCSAAGFEEPHAKSASTPFLAASTEAAGPPREVAEA